VYKVNRAVQTGDIAVTPDVNIHRLNVDKTYKYLSFCESEGVDHTASKQYLIGK